MKPPAVFRRAAAFVLTALLAATVASAQLPRRNWTATNSDRVFLAELRTWAMTASFARTLVLDCNGSGDATDLSDALALLASKPRTANSMWLLKVEPCKYTETTTLRQPDDTIVACTALGPTVDFAWGDYRPCQFIGTPTTDFYGMGRGALVGIDVQHNGVCPSACGGIDWNVGGYVALQDVTVFSTRANVVGIRFDATTTADRLIAQNVKVILENGTGTKGLTFSSAGPGYVEGIVITTNGNGGGTAIEHTGTGDLALSGTVEKWWTTKVNHTGSGKLLLDAVTSDGALLATAPATAPQCERGGNLWVKPGGALCICNGTAWVKVGGEAAVACP